jgi:limonene-1,2-epoxide hydrolase
MKRRNIEVVIGFLDAIRRGDGDAAVEFLEPSIVWRGPAPDAFCSGPGDVVDVFLGQRAGVTEVDRLEVIGADGGAVFAFHRPDLREAGGVEMAGAIYHACAIDDGRISGIEDHLGLADALAALR